MTWYEWLAVIGLGVWFVTEVLIPGAVAIREAIVDLREDRRAKAQEKARFRAWVNGDDGGPER